MTGWVVPTLPSYVLMQAVGTVGAVIMPHNLYLHSGLVLSRKVKRDSPTRVYAAIWYSRIEAAAALLFSFFINLAIIAANASEFFNPVCAELTNGPFACFSTETTGGDGVSNGSAGGGGSRQLCALPSRDNVSGACDELGLQLEGRALAEGLSQSSLYIWALGLLAAGQASTMVCTYAGQIIMGGCLQLELAAWKRVAITRIFALGPALAVALSTVENAKLFININEYLNILQSVQLPFAMLPVLHFASSKRHLGRFASGPILFAVTCCLAFLVLSVNVLLVVQFLQDPPVEDQGDEAVAALPAWAMLLATLYGIVYFGLCIRMMWEEVVELARWLKRVAQRRSLRPPAPQPKMRELAVSQGPVATLDHSDVGPDGDLAAPAMSRA